MHLYVHVPFCVRRCSYCDFSIAVRKRIPAEEYVDAVLAELDMLQRSSPGWVDPGAVPRGESKLGLDTLYFGGGTPSLLPREELTRLITSLFDAFRSTPSLDVVVSPLDVVEVTLEANPEDVTPGNAKAWRAAGVNRVSLGAQSFDDRVLAWMHRSHDSARIGAAVHALRGAGIDNISLDLIFALPEELQRDWARDLDLAVTLLPSHVSIYGLTVEARTPLARWISRGAASPPDDERYATEYLLAHQRLAAAGYHFYEVSNAARDGHRSRHNSAYWSGRPYLGLGPAAHSFDGHARRWNLPAWEAYRRALQAGRSPMESEEVLTPEQRELEALYLGLRTENGVSLSDHPTIRLSDMRSQSNSPTVRLSDRESDSPTVRPSDWVGAGWVEVSGGRVRCTAEGWLRLDELVRALTPDTATS